MSIESKEDADDMKYSELKEKHPTFVKNVVLPYTSTKGNSLHDNYQKFLERILTYLFVTNAGGAVAILSFMASNNKTGLRLRLSLVCLIFYVLGIISVAACLYVSWHYSLRILSSWNEQKGKFFQEKISWNALLKGEDSVVDKKLNWLQRFYAKWAFGMFVIGSILGLIAFLKK